MSRISFLLSLLIITGIKAQLPTGYWRTHLSYANVTEVEKYGDRIFGLSAGSLYYVDVESRSVNTFNRIQGLNDVLVSTIKYHEDLDVLVIGYENGNIDIVQDNIIYNIDDLKESTNFFGLKYIYDIYPYENDVYLATSLGSILVSLNDLEIKDSYTNIGPNGDQIELYLTTINDFVDTIFVHTELGVMSASTASSVNLKDFNNWHIYDSPDDSVYGREIVGLVTFNDTTIVGTKNDGLFYYHKGSWLAYELPIDTYGDLRKISLSDGLMCLIFKENVVFVKSKDDFEIDNNIYADWYDAGREGQYFYMAENTEGIKHNFYGYLWNDKKNGPLQDLAFSLDYFDGKIVSCAGAYSKQNYGKQYVRDGYNILSGSSWTNYPTYTYPQNLSDIVASEYNPFDKSLYFATFDNGLLRQYPSGDYMIYDTTNSPLSKIVSDLLLITDVEVDHKGGLWIANYNLSAGDTSLHVFKTDGSWASYTFPDFEACRPVQIVIDEDDTKWVRLEGTQGAVGLYAFNEENNDYKIFSTAVGNGALPSTIVKSIAVDKENDIWVGTAEGVAVFYNPERVFNSSNFDAERPVFENRPLLREEVVTAIEVDGGNRKWIGTSSGVWLFNPTGTELISHFNVDNSPLFSNSILDIEINEITGEVFISTDAGLISYRGTATEGKETFDNVEVFPNPITTDFDGVLTVSGLVENSNIKITDIAGKLIYETRANGGTAVWNLRNYNGEYAQTGVYLIFAGTPDGEEGYVAKVAVIQK